MNKIKKWIKNNKKKVIMIVTVLVLLILFVCISYAIISFLMPNTKASVYGNRCEVTRDYPVASDRKDKLEAFVSKQDKMKFVNFEVKCNLIDIIVEVDDSVAVSKIKTMAKSMLEEFSDDEIKYYDIEIMIKSNKSDSDSYPMIGVHHKEINGSSTDNFVW